MKPPLPQRIGRYEIVDRLGQGGMGAVYLATDPALGRTVAIKVLTEDNEELRERFAGEARSAAALRHPNIVTIYDVGEDEGRPFIAMEFLDGETIAELIRRGAPMPLSRKLRLMIDLCAGLGYAHRSGIIHRDIKPANLAITADGTLKILDFGIARVTADATRIGLTRVGTLMGSPHYMSPEQAEGLPVDERSDIFSVGLVLYELLSLRRAFMGDSSHVVLNNILTKEPRSIRELCPDLDPELEQVVKRSLVKNPAGRYQTLAEMGADLTRISQRLQDQPEGPTVTMDRPVGARGGTPSGGVTPRSGGAPISAGRNIPNLDVIAHRRAAQIESHLREASAHFEAGRYEQAIEQCEKAVMVNPEEVRALEMLDLAHRALDARQVRQLLADASARLATGSLTEAELLVGQALQLQPDSADAQAALHDLEDRRREQESMAERARAVRAAIARGRANVEAGALEAGLRCASEALAFDAADADALELRRQIVAALAERSRVAEERRRQAAAAEALRQQQAEQAAREAREREEKVEAARDATQRLAREAEATKLIEPAVETLVLNREATPRASQFPGVFEQPEALVEPEVERTRSDAPPVKSGAETQIDRAPWYKNTLVRVAAGALLISGVAAGGWWALRGPAEPPPGSGSGGGQPATPDHTETVNRADALYRDGKTTEAVSLALSIPDAAREGAGAIGLLSRIRRDAESAARTARQSAVSAGVTAGKAFRDGEESLGKADALKQPQDTQQSVGLYDDARLSFGRAASADLSVEQLVQRARDEQRKPRTTDAIDLATQAWTRNPKYQPAIDLLSDLRLAASRAAQDARRRATAAGASPDKTSKFKDALASEQLADTLKAPGDTRSAVSAYRAAEADYGVAAAQAHEAAAAAATFDADIKSALQRLEQALTAEDLAKAQTEFSYVKQKDPGRPLTSWETRISELDARIKKRDTDARAAEERARKALALMQDSRALSDDAAAVEKLKEATALDPNNREIAAELAKRTAALTRLPATRTPNELVLDVLNAFASAYNEKSITGIRKVWPDVPKGYDKDFNFNLSQRWLFDQKIPPKVEVAASGAEATATCRVTTTVTDPRGKTEDRLVVVFSLKKQPQGWEIQSAKPQGTWR